MSQPYDTRAGRLAAALDEFIHSSPDVEAAAVVSFDGLPMASALPDEMEEDRVGAMSAALLSLGEQAAMGLGRGQLNQVFVEGEHGFVFLMSARDQAVLAAVARRTAKIGFMLFEMRRAADRIGHALEPVESPEAAFERHQAQVEAQQAPSEEAHDVADAVDPGYYLDRDQPAEQGHDYGHDQAHHEQAHDDGGHHDHGHHDEEHHEGHPSDNRPFDLVRDHHSVDDASSTG
jgi:predicted regulator of Ras-like GTPase activity (Roadblock/LC7/MglB family)